ncbi:MAG: DegT/DnrJ/EryC1/StrS family aminotransferase [Candidatus Kapabacteria bacterium]|nr:DegT/DnrJ/EryC1/StrS family aminotransferase [Candidatus Kapabacteria bacterium]
MNVPFLDLKANYLPMREEILGEITEVLDNTAYILGPKVSAFETAFATMHGVDHCAAVSSGTDANHLALWALGVGPGDEVIMPANTFVATAWGATLCGATPVFVDCDPRTYNIDPAKVEAAITPRTKAIVAVHLYGQPADMDALRTIANKHRIALVEDAAQAHDAQYNGKHVGGLGDICSFSFYPGKNLGAYGEGGAVTTNNPDLARKVKMLREHGSERKYYHETYGTNYRMEAIQGAVLGVKVKHLHTWTENRRRVAARYNELLRDVEEIVLPYEAHNTRHVYHLYVIQTDNRDALQKHLSECGIATGLHYPVPLHMQKCFEHLEYKQGDFPVSEQLGAQCLSLPMFPEMTDEQVRHVAESVVAYFASSTAAKSTLSSVTV